ERRRRRRRPTGRRPTRAPDGTSGRARATRSGSSFLYLKGRRRRRGPAVQKARARAERVPPRLEGPAELRVRARGLADDLPVDLERDAIDAWIGGRAQDELLLRELGGDEEAAPRDPRADAEAAVEAAQGTAAGAAL